MASLPKLRAFGPTVRNDSKHPRRYPNDSQRTTKVPSSDLDRPHRDPLLNSHLEKGARLASFDHYDSPEEDGNLSETTFQPSDTRCPLIAKDDDDDDDENLDRLLHSTHLAPAVLEVGPSAQLPIHPQYQYPAKPFHHNSLPTVEAPDDEMENSGKFNQPDKQNVSKTVTLSPSPSLEKPPLSPAHGYPNDDRVNTMSTECSSQQPPAYSATEHSGPENMSPFFRFRSAVHGVHAAVRITRMQRLQKKAKWASKKFLVFTLSKVGLTCVVVAYAIFGAFLFQHLEGRGSETKEAPKTSRLVAAPHTACLPVRQFPEYEQVLAETEQLRYIFPG
ncbi:hypothetical protein ElyMa_005422700 [Elysia marginata]|uniref:Uncharacterized protein n=1 Tax=Elysia marginata TaxID=1093978 RepID=A0AAV4EK24_9GAST|nr:hypothetical protein ElyMa_005422700 [Elysia marginata]